MADARVQRVLAALGLRVESVHNGRAWALCPWHQAGETRGDWATSFGVQLAGKYAGSWKCFACGEGGPLVDLVVKVLDFGTREAAEEWLDQNHKAPPGPAPSSVRLEVPALFRPAFRVPAGAATGAPLSEWPAPAAEYARSRGLTDAQVERWGVTYALEGRLAGRLVVPLRDRQKRWVSYMARTFVDSKRRYYYPSRDDEHPDLDAVFGEEHWPELAGRLAVVVTEGALKSLAVERVTGLPVAALGGSEVRPMHAAKVATFATAVLLTDADEAGEKARAELAAALGRHTRVEHARLAPGRDADTVPISTLAEVLRAWYAT